MLSPIIVLIGAVFSIYTPETLDKANTIVTPGDPGNQENTGTPQAPSTEDNLLRGVVSKAKHFGKETEFIWKNPKLLISLAIVFAGILDKSSLFLLIQYASMKFLWTISQVGSQFIIWCLFD